MPIVDVKTATEIFKKFNKNLKSSYFHPDYVVADAAKCSNLNPTFYVYEEENSFFYHAFHTQQVPETNFIDIQSPYGYGGPISTSESPVFLSKAWREYDNWCESKNVLVEFIRFHPLLENCKYFYGDVVDNRETIWIDLNHENILSQYSPRMRTSIRKGYRQGLKVHWVDPAKNMLTFQSIYKDGMTALQASRFYFFSEEYFNKLAASQLVWLGFCYNNLVPIAGAVFLVSENMCEYHLGASTNEGKEYGAMKIIFHEAALKAQSCQLKNLYLGGGSDTSANNTLLMYKRKFSSNKATFRIGKRIHKIVEYDHLKAKWEASHQSSTDKVLFYR